MNAAVQNLFAELHQQGLTISSIVAGKLAVTPKDKITPEMREAVIRHRGDLLHLLRDRNATAADLVKLYGEVGTTDAGRVLMKIPGWVAELKALEEAFTSKWQAGGDPWGELEAIRRHKAEIVTLLTPYFQEHTKHRCIDCMRAGECPDPERKRRNGLIPLHDCREWRGVLKNCEEPIVETNIQTEVWGMENPEISINDGAYIATE